ncbi:hypothetical protein FRC07_003572 [Ceratobasidium sp. 392]|nr:hypothetical protein FRC07_003572 [Ceratobasidium sp. 392]
MEEALRQFAARQGTLEMEIKRLKSRLRLLGCAMRRAEKAGGERCGFDARMVMNDEEWAEWLGGWGKWAMEELAEGEDQKDDDAYGRDEGSFCTGKKRCERHYGWQNLKFADFSGECTAKESQLADVNSKSQETQRKATELRRMMSSMARPPIERVGFSPKVDNAMAA